MVLSIVLLKGVDLLEYVEVALVASFQRLVSFSASENFIGALVAPLIAL